MAAERPPRSLLARWGFRAATVLVSALILYWALYGISYEELRRAARGADLTLAVLGAAVPLFVFWITDALFTVRSFAWCGRPVPFKSYLVIKAAAYLLNMVNIAFSTGGVFLYFLKKTGISSRAQAGLLLWRLDMAVFGVVIFFTLLIAGGLCFPPAVTAKMDLGLILPVLAASLLIIAEWSLYWLKGGGLVMKRLPLDSNAEFWTAFRIMGPTQWVKGLAYTLPPILVNFFGMYLCARAFRLEVPLIYFMIWIPLAALLSALPIAFGGFGTTTAAWAAFFAPYGAHADIVALTVFIPAVRLITRALFGIIFMPLATREIESLARETEK
ncbi:MAG TPA: lysylphosphatidylglycerol synthase domain-containing protein [bacterium]|nr:lysylphosphatidylglycerol synthase domain-containing protein [bacterium]